MSKYNKSEKEEVIKKYESGQTIAQISKEAGISRGTIYSWLKQSRKEKLDPVNMHTFNLLKQKCERLAQMVEILKAVPCTVSSPRIEKYETIKELSSKYSISLLCETLDVPKGSYFNYLLRNKNDNTLAAQKRKELKPVIEKIFHDNNEIFGSGKIHAILKDRGYKVAKETVADIMHENGIFPIRTSSKKLYLKKQERKRNLLNRQFNVSRPNEVWVGDVTYYNFKEKNYYICVILDLFSRKIISCRVSLHNSTQLISAAFKEAYASRDTDETLMFHSDQGANYTSKTYQKLLRDYNVKQSFSKAGVPYDNSVVESFFKNMKAEELYRTRYHSESEFRKAVNKYVEFYNTKRPHNYLNNKTPDEAEKNYYKKRQSD